jgi:L-seryl-tRNA(Ser) seleniumtransferase
MNHGRQVKSVRQIGTEPAPDPRRGLPAVTRVIEAVRALQPGLPDWAVADGTRLALQRAREGLAQAPGEVSIDPDGLAAQAAALAEALSKPHPRRVVNATGVILHTNLGRAVLGEGAAQAVYEVASPKPASR